MIKHRCGHSTVKRIIAPIRERLRIIRSNEELDCMPCATGDDARLDRQWESALRLPQLTGTTKQRQWASQVRIVAIETAERRLEQALGELSETAAAQILAAFEKICSDSPSAARWWIDNRASAADTLLRRAGFRRDRSARCDCAVPTVAERTPQPNGITSRQTCPMCHACRTRMIPLVSDLHTGIIWVCESGHAKRERHYLYRNSWRRPTPEESLPGDAAKLTAATAG